MVNPTIANSNAHSHYGWPYDDGSSLDCEPADWVQSLNVFVWPIVRALYSAYVRLSLTSESSLLEPRLVTRIHNRQCQVKR